MKAHTMGTKKLGKEAQIISKKHKLSLRSTNYLKQHHHTDSKTPPPLR
jgi:hypothetical protein